MRIQHWLKWVHCTIADEIDAADLWRSKRNCNAAPCSGHSRGSERVCLILDVHTLRCLHERGLSSQLWNCTPASHPCGLYPAGQAECMWLLPAGTSKPNQTFWTLAQPRPHFPPGPHPRCLVDCRQCMFARLVAVSRRPLSHHDDEEPWNVSGAKLTWSTVG